MNKWHFENEKVKPTESGVFIIEILKNTKTGSNCASGGELYRMHYDNWETFYEDSEFERVAWMQVRPPMNWEEL